MTMPPGSGDSSVDDRLSELAEEFIASHRLGAAPQVEDYVNRYPDLGSRIRELFPTLMILEELGPPRDQDRHDATAIVTVPIPSRIGDYRLVREIGRGGMGIVFEAEQISLVRTVALKILSHRAALDPRMIERFQIEARSAGRLHHPHIIPVFDVGQADGYYYYAMQLIDGLGLDQILERLQLGPDFAATRQIVSTHRDREIAFGPDRDNNSMGLATSEDRRASDVESDLLSSITGNGAQNYYRQIARMGMHVAESLTYAHSAGVLHRDIKPSNLILDYNGAVWIADFGLAKATSATDSIAEGVTSTGDIVGTMRYMAPERFRGWSDPRSDVYGLGITLYEALTLRPAFESQDRVVLIDQVLHHTPRRPRTIDRKIPVDLETIVLKAIDKEPSRRYTRADDLAADLRNFLEYRTILARRASYHEVARQWCRRNPIVACLVATLLLAILGGWISTTIQWRKAVANLATAKSATLAKDAALIQARRAEADRTKQLRQSLLQQARSARSSAEPGSRAQALRAVREAAAIQTGLDLRNEAIAAMALFDIGATPEWTQPIASVSAIFTPSLEYFLSAVDDQSAVVRDRHGKTLAKFAAKSFDGMFSSDGKYLLLKTGPRFGEVGIEHLQMIDWRANKVLKELTGIFSGRPFDIHPADNEWAVHSDDGKITFYDLLTCRELRQFELPGAQVTLRYHPSGKYLAYIDSGKATVSRLDVQNGNTSQLTTNAPAGLRGHISFNDEGSLFAAGSWNWRTYVWDTQTGELVSTLVGHNAEVSGALFAPSSNLLATWGWDQTIRIRDPLDGRVLSRIDGTCGRFNVEGEQLAVVSGSVARVLRCAPSREFKSLRGHVGKEPKWSCFSRDGHIVVSSGADGVRFWDVASGRLLASIPLLQTTTTNFVADETALITASSKGLYHWPIHRSQDRWEIGPPTALIDEFSTERRATPIPGQPLIAVAGENVNRIDILSLGSSELRSIPCGKLPNECYASPNGKWVVATSFKNRWASVFDLQTGRLLCEFPGQNPSSFAFSRDCETLVVANRQGAHVYSCKSWEIVKSLPLDSNGEQPSEVAFDSTGTILAIARSDGIIKLLDGQDYFELARLESPDRRLIRHMTFSDDGRLLSACVNGGLQLWDLQLIREQLAEMKLDWEPSNTDIIASLPPVTPEVVIDGGDLVSETNASP